MKVYIITATNEDSGHIESVWLDEDMAYDERERLGSIQDDGHDNTGGRYGYDVEEWEIREKVQ